MELNRSPSPEKSDPAPAATAADEQKSDDPATATATDEQCSSPSQTQARTYECNFCKRGFSNAQALGGHMNIHRKDKAKLKQVTSSITETPPPSQQFSKTQPSNIFRPISTNALVVPPNYDQEARRGATASWNWNFSSSDITSMPSNQLGVVGELRQLPLFKETSSKTEDRSEKDLNSSSSSSHGGDDDHELDLELRLGHEPSSDSSKGTRKFF